MPDAATQSDLGLYVPRALLESVPEPRRPEYLRAVQEFAGRKYQIAVEVARQLPAVLAGDDPGAATRYLDGVRAVAASDWRAGVEAARYLQHLQSADDPSIAEGYAGAIADAVASSIESRDDDVDMDELRRLEAELEELADSRARVEELRTELSHRRQRASRRQDRATDLASELPGALEILPPRHHAAFLEQIRRVAQADPDAALAATATLVELQTDHHFSPEALAAWVDRGLHVLDRNAEIGRAYFRMATKQSLADLEDLREGLRLRQVARVLKLYATALSGRDVMIRATNELAGLDLLSYEHIALPPEMGAFETDDDNFRAYKVATAHGAGRIEFGTYGFRLADISDTVATLQRRYPVDEIAL